MASLSSRRLERIGDVLSLAGVIIGVAALVGHLRGAPTLAGYVPGRPLLQPLASVMIVFGGFGVLFSAHAEGRRWLRPLGLALGACVIVASTLVVSEYALGIDLAIDRFVPPMVDDGAPHPGRPSPLTALGCLSIGAAVIAFDWKVPRGIRPRELFSAVAIFLAFLALVGHLFGASVLYDVDPYPLRGVAIPTGLAILAIGGGALLARPREGAMRFVASGGPGGVLVRRVGLAAALITTAAAGALMLGVEALGIRDTALISGLATVTTVSIVLILVATTAVPLERLHEAEQRSRQRIADLVGFAPIGVFVADFDGTYTEANESALALLGYTREELLGKNVLDVLPPDDHARLLRSKERLLAGSVEVERWVLRGRDGRLVPVEVTAKILPDGRWQAFAIDVRKRLELEGRVAHALDEIEFLSRAGVELAACLEPEETQSRVCELAIERLCDLCALDAFDDGELRRAAFGHGLAEPPPLLEGFASAIGSAPEDEVTRVLPETGERLVERLSRTSAEAAAYMAVGLHSVMRVPMFARGQLVAVLTLGACDRRFDDDDVRLAEELASRAAISLDNVRLYHESRLQAAMITNLAEGVFLIRAEDRRIVFTNPRFDEMLGYERGELIGCEVQTINAPSDVSAKERADEIIAELEARGVWRGEILNRKKDGTPVWHAASVSTYEHERHGKVWMSAHADIDAKRRLEAEAERALREKEVLLQEIHHRVKNNLQVISSLFSLQRGRTSSPEVREMLDESRLRIQSIALVHEQLYRATDLAAVDFDEYLRGLVAAIRATYGVARVDVRAESEGDFLEIEEAVPSALILAELIANALKHAFVGGRAGSVNVSARTDDADHCVLEVADDGVGIPEDFDWTETRSLGLRIVRDLTRQLRGTASLHREGGTRFVIRFPLRRRELQPESTPRIEA